MLDLKFIKHQFYKLFLSIAATAILIVAVSSVVWVFIVLDEKSSIISYPLGKAIDAINHAKGPNETKYSVIIDRLPNGEEYFYDNISDYKIKNGAVTFENNGKKITLSNFTIEEPK